MTFKFPSAFLAPLALYCNSSGLSKHVDDDNMLLTTAKIYSSIFLANLTRQS